MVERTQRTDRVIHNAIKQLDKRKTALLRRMEAIEGELREVHFLMTQLRGDVQDGRES